MHPRVNAHWGCQGTCQRPPGPTAPLIARAESGSDHAQMRRPNLRAQASPAAFRIMGVRRRVGSESTSPKETPLGQIKPWLNTSSLSPRTEVTVFPDISRTRPQFASQRGQIRSAVRSGSDSDSMDARLPPMQPCVHRKLNFVGGLAITARSSRSSRWEWSGSRSIPPGCSLRKSWIFMGAFDSNSVTG